MPVQNLKDTDAEVYEAVRAELGRQRNSIELIASENFTSRAVMEAMGSVCTNKYAEGYPAKRYYGGCVNVDVIENIARERACKLFNANFSNVQPHSGANANLAAYFALIKPGDKIMGMSLDHGGHLTHGSPVNFSGKLYDICAYGVDPETETIDYDAVEKRAKEERPALIVAGASAYPRKIDFKRFAEIAHEVGAYLMVDMAHIAGLVAAGCHQNPVDYADVVTSTTHKTLRGPRGGFILTNNEELAKKIDSAVFPGTQGGPLMHVIAGKAVAFGEALKPEFKDYIGHVLENCQSMAKGIADGGLRLVSGGTDNHLCLVDLTAADVTGKEAEAALGVAGLTVNKNTIPNETRSPFVTSGIRVGTAAATTTGLNSEEFYHVGDMISRVAFNASDEATLKTVREQVSNILENHVLYEGMVY